MSLNIQIISLVFSFFYGIFFSFFVNLNYSFLMFPKKVIRITMILLFFLNMAFIYFVCLQLINNGIIHPYFFLMIFMGFIFSFSFFKKLRK